MKLNTAEQEGNEEAVRKRWSQQCHAGRKALSLGIVPTGVRGVIQQKRERARGLSVLDSCCPGHS